MNSFKRVFALMGISLSFVIVSNNASADICIERSRCKPRVIGVAGSGVKEPTRTIGYDLEIKYKKNGVSGTHRHYFDGQFVGSSHDIEKARAKALERAYNACHASIEDNEFEHGLCD